MSTSSNSEHPSASVQPTSTDSMALRIGRIQARMAEACARVGRDPAKLAPGGFHMMFLQLTGPFKQGDLIPVVLKFEKAGEVRVNFTVKPSTYNPSSAGGHSHGGMQH